MTEQVWIRVAPAAHIPLREGRPVRIGGRDIAVFNLGDRFLATDNRCPHQGGPLCDGIVTGSSVVCPLHAWKVSLADGSVERPGNASDHCVETYPVRVEDGIVAVAIPLIRVGDDDRAATAGGRPSGLREPGIRDGAAA
jgi:nitrite reductase (NADH) small subunit